jgi:Ca-activated chloride channel family protein
VLVILTIFCGAGLLDASTAGSVSAGNRAYRNGAYDQSLDKYREAQIAAPDNPILHFNIGDALYKIGKTEEAATAFQRALAGKDARLRSQAYYNLGNSAYRKEQLDEALEYYKKALDINPGDRDAKYNFEYILRQKAMPQSKKNKQQRERKEQKGNDKQQQGAQGKTAEKSDQEQGDKKGMSKEDAQRILQVYGDQDQNAAKNRKMPAPQLPKVEEDW